MVYLSYLCLMENTTEFQIVETIGNYDVKDLTWLKNDGVYRGLVKDPICGRESLHNGYIVLTWRRNGKVMSKWNFKDRTDLNLKIN